MASATVDLQVPWVEKYRPKSLNEIVSHRDVLATIRRFVEVEQMPHMLLHGPPGTGKTTTAQAVCRMIFGPRTPQMVLELNASDDRGINVVRDTIKAFAECRSTLGTTKFLAAGDESMEGKEGAVKLVVLDEADHMTGAAQDALRRTMELYASNVRFILMCNFVNKIKPAIQSRCTKFRFPPLTPADMTERGRVVIKSEGLLISEAALEALVLNAAGDMRKVLNTMQACWMIVAPEEIGSDLVHSAIGLPLVREVEEIMKSLTCEDYETSYAVILSLITTRGYALSEILGVLYRRCLRVDWPTNCAQMLFPRLGEIEQRLVAGADQEIQLGCLVAAFVEVRQECETAVADLPFCAAR